MITRVTPDSLARLLKLRQQFLAVYLRPAAPTIEQAATALLNGQSIGALINEQDGYFIAHAAPWQGQSALWIDEVYLRPEFRKRGVLAEIAAWWKGYAEYNGLALVVGTVFSLEEGKPFRQHLGAIPACTILQVAVSDLQYRPSLLPVTAHPQAAEVPAGESPLPPPVARRPRKKRGQVKAEGTVIPAREKSQLDATKEAFEYARATSARLLANGIEIERHGKLLPLGARPEEM